MKPSAKPIAFVDVDDTISDTIRYVLEQINKEREQPYRFDELTLDFREGKNEGKEYGRAVREFLKPDIIGDTAPYPNALKALERLHRAGYEIHIVSSRRERLHEVTAQWPQRHGFADFVEHVHPRPDHIDGKRFKRDLAQRIKPAALFDDTLDVVLELAESVDRIFLIDKPWNNDVGLRLPANVTRSVDFAAAVDSLLT